MFTVVCLIAASPKSRELPAQPVVHFQDRTRSAAFGNITDDSATSIDVLFRYTARPFDEDGQLQNNLNRWYGLSTGRWMSVDPIGFEAGDVNLYRYVGNSTVALIDPGGLLSQGDIQTDVRTRRNPLDPLGTFDWIPDRIPDTRLADWTQNDAVALMQAMITAMRAEGNNYAAGLHNAWLTSAGGYTPTAADKAQVKADAADMVSSLVGSYMDKQDIDAPWNCPKTVNIAGLATEEFGGTCERGRFGFMSNINMFFAFAGFGYKITGTATRTAERGVIDCECDYTVAVSVSLLDNYTFDNLGPANYRLANTYYNAAYWLEKNGHAKPFKHQITYSTNVAWTAE